MIKEATACGFRACGVRSEIVWSLNTNFGIYKDMGTQSKTISAIMSIDRPNVVIGDQTGTGKSLSYLIPIVQGVAKFGTDSNSLPVDTVEEGCSLKATPRALIIAPSKELAVQLDAVLSNLINTPEFKVNSALVIGGERISLQSKKLGKGVDIVIGTPGRINNIMSQMSFRQLQFLVFDEFDTIFENPRSKLVLKKGQTDRVQETDQEAYQRSFLFDVDSIVKKVHEDRNPSKKTDYWSLKLKQLDLDAKNKKQPPVLQSVLVSATIRNLASLREKYFKNKPFVQIKGEDIHLPRSSVHINWRSIGKEDKQVSLLNVIGQFNEERKKNHTDRQTIVFCNSIPSANSLSYFLDENGVRNVNMHGAIASQNRIERLEEFLEDKEPIVLVSTDVGCRGLDFPDVGLVCLFDFPKTPTDFLHRVGRTGRGNTLDGGSKGKGKVVVLVNSREESYAKKLKEMFKNRTPLIGHVHKKRDRGNVAMNKASIRRSRHLQAQKAIEKGKKLNHTSRRKKKPRNLLNGGTHEKRGGVYKSRRASSL